MSVICYHFILNLYGHTPTRWVSEREYVYVCVCRGGGVGEAATDRVQPTVAMVGSAALSAKQFPLSFVASNSTPFILFHFSFFSSLLSMSLHRLLLLRLQLTSPFLVSKQREL